jgi:hypothetical protein
MASCTTAISWGFEFTRAGVLEVEAFRPAIIVFLMKQLLVHVEDVIHYLRLVCVDHIQSRRPISHGR